MKDLEYLISVWEDDGGRGWIRKHYAATPVRDFGPSNKELHRIEKEEELLDQIEVCYEKLQTYREEEEQLLSDSFHDRVRESIIHTAIDTEVRKLLALELKLVDLRLKK